MIAVSVTFYEPTPPRVEVLRIASTNERFIMVSLDENVSLNIAGVDGTAIAHARLFARALLAAADKLEAERAADAPPAADPPAELPAPPEPIADEEFL